MDKLGGDGLVGTKGMGLPPAASCQFRGPSEQPSLRPPRAFLRPHKILQGPFDKPKETDQLDVVGEVARPGRKGLRLTMQQVCESGNNRGETAGLSAPWPWVEGWRCCLKPGSSLSFLGGWNLEPHDVGSIGSLTLSLSLLLCQARLVHLLIPPQQLLAGQGSGHGPRRFQGPFLHSGAAACLAGPTLGPPAPSRARQSGFLPALTTVLAAKANISAARPRTHSPLGPPH